MKEELVAEAGPAVALPVLLIGGAVLLAVGLFFLYRRVRRRWREGREDFEQLRREARSMKTDPEGRMGAIEAAPD